MATTHTLVRVTFEDYEQWKSVFEEATQIRASYGSLGVQAFRNPEKPNEALIFGEYEDADRAREMFQSQEFRATIGRAGVIGQPEVTFLNEVARLPG